MVNKDYDDDEVNALIAAGFLIAGAVIGTYIIAKALGSYQKGQVVGYSDIAQVKEEISAPSRVYNPTENYKYGNCSNHGHDVEFCQRDNHCMKCGGGVEGGDTSLRWCYECDWDFRNNNDD